MQSQRYILSYESNKDLLIEWAKLFFVLSCQNLTSSGGRIGETKAIFLMAIKSCDPWLPHHPSFLHNFIWCGLFLVLNINSILCINVTPGNLKMWILWSIVSAGYNCMQWSIIGKLCCPLLTLACYIEVPNNGSVVSWGSTLLVEETGLHGEKCIIFLKYVQHWHPDNVNVFALTKSTQPKQDNENQLKLLQSEGK